MSQPGLRGLQLLCEALDALAIRYCVVGGLASATWGQSRFTEDIDIAAELSASQVLPLKAALGGDFEVDELSLAEACRQHRSDNFFYLPDFIRFDVYVPAPTAFVSAQFDRRKRIDLGEGAQVFVASPEDTALSKLLWYRKGGEVSTKQWEDIVGILRYRASELDREYLETWAERLDVSALLGRALRDANLTG